MSGTLESAETEQALLGAIFAKQEALEEVAGFLDAEDFYDPVHQDIYRVIRRLAHEGRVYNPTTMAPFFANAEPIGQLTVVQYLGKLLGSVTSLRHTKEYGQLVKEFSNRRKFSEICIRGQQLAGDFSVGLAQIAAESVQDLDGIISASRPNQLSRMPVEACAQQLLHDLDNGLVEQGIPSGLLDYDRITGGFRRREFDIVAARPSVGKTAFGSSIMLPVARAGYGVMLFSLEMSRRAIAARCLSDLVWNRDTPIPYAGILRNRVTSDHEKDRLRRALRLLTGLPLEIEDQGALTLAEIAARSRQQAARFERKGKSLDLIIIDHIGKIRPSARYAGNMVAEAGEVSQGLAALAKDLNVAVLGLHQLNRAVEGREDKRPQLSDLRNSGDFEQDADMVAFLYRAGYYLERRRYETAQDEDERKELLEERRHDLEVIISKNRNGPTCTVDLFCDVASNAVRNRA